MRKLTYAFALLLTIAAILLILAPPLHAQSDSKLGVWRATIDGVPAVTLTLADDTGSLGGTVVFYAVNGETKRAMTIEPHTLLHPALDGDTLTFQVKMRPGARTPFITIKVLFTAPTKAQLHCLDCGDSPTADLTKDAL